RPPYRRRARDPHDSPPSTRRGPPFRGQDARRSRAPALRAAGARPRPPQVGRSRSQLLGAALRAAGTPKRESTASSDDKIECVVPIASAVPGAVTALLKLCPLSPGKVAFAWKTAVGAALERVTAVRLERGVLVVAEAVRRAGIDPRLVDECIMGNVVSAGLGQNPARQAALNGGLSDSVAALTINKVCGSGLKAVMLVTQGIATGDIDIAV